jgi:SOS-response transcriptional repressor LexA
MRPSKGRPEGESDPKRAGAEGSPVNDERRVVPIVHKRDPEANAKAGACAGAEPFALMVIGDSMAPEFDDGDIVVVEPDGLATDGAFVVAEAADGWTLRQLQRTESGWQLGALNPAYAPDPIANLGAVRGVVIQKSRPGRRSTIKRYVD